MSDKAANTCYICHQELSALERVIAFKQDDVYVCHGCCDNLCRKAGTAPFENFSLGKFLAKLLFGFLCIFSITTSDDIGASAMLVIIGLALIAWALVPQWLEKTRCDSLVAQVVSKKAEEAEALHTCKACGGISSGKYCAYCGKPFDEGRGAHAAHS